MTHLEGLSPDIWGPLYVSNSPEERWTGNGIFTVIFHQNQTPIDQGIDLFILGTDVLLKPCKQR